MDLEDGIAKASAGELGRSPAEPALPLPLDEPIITNPEIQREPAAGEEIVGKVFDVSISIRSNRQQSSFSSEWAKE